MQAKLHHRPFLPASEETVSLYLAELAEQGRKTQSLPNTQMGLRDRALLLLGFAGAFRRSELIALDRSDLEFLQEGLKVTIRRSKTDQE